MKASRNKRLCACDRPRGPVCRVVSAYVTGNALPPHRLAPLIAIVSDAFGTLHRPPPLAEPPLAVPFVPAPGATGVEIRSSVTPDGLRSFEDGMLYKTLRRHLRSRGLDPNAYRSKWGLPADYPMTCPAYSERRSAIARKIRLGHVS